MHWGDLCLDCRAERVRRASRLSSRISLPATLLVALYVTLRMPALPLARVYAVVVVAATYLLLRRIVTRVAMEFLPQ